MYHTVEDISVNSPDGTSAFIHPLFWRCTPIWRLGSNFFIGAKLGGTVMSQVVGYYVRNKNDHQSGGSISPPAGDIGAPFSSTWVLNGAQNTLEKSGI